MYNGRISDYYRDRIKEDTILAFEDYINKGVPPGDFLYACLTDSLTKAVGSADLSNQRAIVDIAYLMYNELPSCCWGNKDKVDRYLNFKRVLRQFKEGDRIEFAEEVVTIDMINEYSPSDTFRLLFDNGDECWVEFEQLADKSIVLRS